jgi:hypothetical protein
MTRKFRLFAASFPRCHHERVKVRPVWLLTLPILLLGETAGHAIMSRLLDPGEPRHGLFDLAAVASTLAALSVAALVWRAATSVRSEPQPLPSWRLAAVPAAAFLVQEHLESFVSDGHAGWLTAADPAVLTGLVLQLAVGAAVLWLARSLLRAADQLGWLLARRAARAGRARARTTAWPFEAAPSRLSVLASRQAGRAPPAAA